MNAKSKIIVVLAATITMGCVLSLTACQSSTPSQTLQAEPAKQEELPLQETTKDNRKETNEINKEVKNSSNKIVPSNKNSFDRYLGLIGLAKESLASTLGEQPTNIDEGGWEFKNAGIRVWFKSSNGQTYVDQIFMQKQDIDFNGVKVGDPISSFEQVFGKPVTENKASGEKHFKYKDIFLSVNYDTHTNKAFAVYILKNNY